MAEIMPIPKPTSGQSESDYMSVCMTFLDKEKSKYPEHKQRVAICLSTYRKSNESDDELIKRLEMMINDTTVAGDVALPQGQVIGMQYRKKKKKVRGGASYPVHEQYLMIEAKGVTRDEAKSLLKRINSIMRPEMIQPNVTQNGPWWDLSIRDYKYFTPRDGEEDDDHPDFTGSKEFLKKIKPIMKGLDWQFSPEEKDWITILIKAKKLTKKQMSQDKKKPAKNVLAAVQGESADADDNFWRQFYKNMIPELKKYKKKFITKIEFFSIAEKTKWYDGDAAEEVWSMA